MYFVWTDEALKAEALKYNTRSEFAEGNQTAYTSARKRGKDFYNSVCSHMKYVRIYWTDEMLHEEAHFYTTTKEFRKGSPNAYAAAVKRGILSSVYKYLLPEYLKWTKELAHEEALKYDTRVAFQNGSPKAYKAGLWHKWTNEICSHMYYQHKSWSFDLIHTEALKYDTISGFRYGSPRAYRAAKEYKIVKKVCSHTIKSKRETDNDTIYIWQDLDNTYKNKPVYKIGVTSKRCEKRRISEGTSKAGVFNYRIITLTKVKGKATDLEKQLLKLGDDPKYPSVLEGYTEFRALSEKELQQALTMIEKSRDQRYTKYEEAA